MSEERRWGGGAKGMRKGWCGDLSIAQVKAMREKGVPIRLIAEAAMVCEETVRRCCHRHHITGTWGGARRRGLGVPPILRRIITATAIVFLPVDQSQEPQP